MLKSDSLLRAKGRMPRLAFEFVFFFLLSTFHCWDDHVFIMYTVPDLRADEIFLAFIQGEIKGKRLLRIIPFPI